MAGVGFARCCRAEAGALRVRVRLTPRSSTEAVDGIKELSDGSAVLAVRVRAVPEDGAANAALVRVLAEALAVPRSAVAVVGGHKARLKEVRITADPAGLLDLGGRLWP